jgi:hypothetical protein
MGGGGGGSRQAPRLDASTLFESQSVAVTRFFADREGPEFVGHLVDALARGANISAALSRSRMLPTDMPELERAWKMWLSSFQSSGR